VTSGTGTIEFESGGTAIRRKVPEKFFFGRAPSTFFNHKSTISRFVERFLDGQ